MNARNVETRLREIGKTVIDARLNLSDLAKLQLAISVLEIHVQALRAEVGHPKAAQ
jgi:hypothetical protein